MSFSIKSYVFIFLILILTLLFPNMIPQEKAFPEAFENITTLNNETVKPSPEQEPLMSIIDDISAEDEEPGWWKHDGHSTVSYASSEEKQNIKNVNESNEKPDNDEESKEGSENEDESDNGKDSNEGSENEENTGDNNQEIPEFSIILIPLMIVLCIALFFRK
ncbi:MAG: hypothetical protein RBT65_15985 [Methanolobus sp.]|nr:hypothetical protein [Methanolobus sp.]